MTENTRRLAAVEHVDHIRPIDGADAIEVARVRGWDVVVGKGQFRPGDLAVYIEVDSFLPLADARFAFLGARGTRTDERGVEGHVLKTAKLRGQYSQGILFSIEDFPEVLASPVGGGITELLGITKWDPALPAHLAGVARGPLPSWIARTDEERVQNVPGLLDVALPGGWIATEKIDGTSLTAYIDGDLEGVCSRNLDLIETDGNSLWRAAREHNLHAALRTYFPNVRAVVQGELFGPNIQGNPLQMRELSFRAFTVQVAGVELPRTQWPLALRAIAVPLHELPFPSSIEEALSQADAVRSKITFGLPVEGIVWRGAETARSVVDGVSTRASFKAISNRYLMKHDR